MAKPKNTPAKKAVQKNRPVHFLSSMPPHRLIQAILGVFVIAGAGAYYVLSSIAGNSQAVPSSANSIVLEYRAPHSHGVSPDVLPEFDPQPAILYGDGLLVCASNTKNHGSPLRSTRLTPSGIENLVAAVSNTGVYKEPVITTENDFATDEAEESVATNFLSGAKKTTYFAGIKPQGLIKAEQVIDKECGKVKSDFQPEGIIFTSKKTVTADPELTIIEGVGLPLASSDETESAELHGIEARTALNTFDGHSKAALRSQGRRYEATIQPLLPTADPISFSKHRASHIAVAASYVPMRWYWFRPSDKALYSGYSEYTAVDTSVHNFFAAQIYNKSASQVNGGVIVGTQTAAYYHACHVGPCGSADQNAYLNVRAEMQSRNYLPAGQSVNVLSQISSGLGSSYCSGQGGPIGIGGARKASTSFAITYGYGTTCEVGSLKYWVAAHEYGHTLGLEHTCGESGSLMDNCVSYSSSTPWTSGFHINASQKADLNINSLGLNHRIVGKVYNGSTGVGIAGASIYTCTGLGTIKTDSTGVFDARIGTKAGFCIRVTGGAPSGYKLTTYNNSEHAGVASYEYQVAGYNCYHNTACTVSQQTWDRTADSGYNFNYTP